MHHVAHSILRYACTRVSSQESPPLKGESVFELTQPQTKTNAQCPKVDKVRGSTMAILHLKAVLVAVTHKRTFLGGHPECSRVSVTVSQYVFADWSRTFGMKSFRVGYNLEGTFNYGEETMANRGSSTHGRTRAHTSELRPQASGFRPQGRTCCRSQISAFSHRSLFP